MIHLTNFQLRDKKYMKRKNENVINYGTVEHDYVLIQKMFANNQKKPIDSFYFMPHIYWLKRSFNMQNGVIQQTI